MNLDIDAMIAAPPTKQRMNAYVLLKFRYIPKLSEIREWENQTKPLMGRFFTNHEVFSSYSAAIRKGDEWINVEDSIEDMFDDFADDCGIFYLEEYQPFQLGIKIDTGRTIMSDTWLSDYVDRDFVKDLAFEYKDQVSSPHLQLEQIVQGILDLEWESAVDWESGHDEGNFVPGKIKWFI